MDLIIPPGGSKTVAVYRALREAIVDGRLPAGSRLPASRALAADLGIARGSVAGAYERLAAEGYLAARVGAGTFVAAVATSRSSPKRGSLRPRKGWTFEPLPTSGGAAVPRYDFRVGIPDAGLFPFDAWRRLLVAETRLRANSLGTYAEPSGHPALRAAIARHLGMARGIPAGAGDVVVTNGTQHALDLIGRVLITPGDVVAVEDPGYPPARRLFASLGARVVGVPVDAEGLVVAAIPAASTVVYATPAHQFPLGRAMSPRRRRELLDWAGRRSVAIVEDDYDSEFRFSARPLEPLYSLDTAGRVLYAGTFSKSMLPSLRTGFLLAPPGLRDALVAARQMGDGHGQPAVQAALARFIDDGLLARHVRRAGKAYAQRRDAMMRHLIGRPGLSVILSAAGLHMAAVTSADSTAVVREARRAGIAVDDLRDYYFSPAPAEHTEAHGRGEIVGSGEVVGGGAVGEGGAGAGGFHSTGQGGFVFGFGAADPALIGEGLGRFAEILARHS
ncbi:GntR family transcriptional regulator [Paractinoplanes deccanensis]|uniref:GntR family transcriptional regulator n=1 Tax=Paractinoplanes deccanensis TaxID=113561 RepID=A0ABQ3YGL7_9ACTN|nr:PLP-dependent aminotransferase family protein [Actinoplanes deccanensis]GID79158.1 GntR family transcriptional regulator [Actinoplanes deccanensis]